MQAPEVMLDDWEMRVGEKLSPRWTGWEGVLMIRRMVFYTS